MILTSITIEHEGSEYTFDQNAESVRKNGKFVFLENVPEKVVLTASLIFQENRPNE